MLSTIQSIFSLYFFSFDILVLQVTVGVQLAHQLSFHLGLMCHRLQVTIIIFNVKTLIKRSISNQNVYSRAGPVPFPILWPSSTKTSLILLLRIIVGEIVLFYYS